MKNRRFSELTPKELASLRQLSDERLNSRDDRLQDLINQFERGKDPDVPRSALNRIRSSSRDLAPVKPRSNLKEP